MKVSIRQVKGNWDRGLVLDKHSVSSTFVGHSESGRPIFETIRTEVGEATYQLKYRGDWSKIQPLAQQLAHSIYGRFGEVGLIVPMPASNRRARQPVTEVARALGKIVKTPVFEALLLKTANGKALKDLTAKEDKVAALADSFSIRDEISGEGSWNALLVDDLFHTGASAEAACAALASYRKIARIYFAALTWR